MHDLRRGPAGRCGITDLARVKRVLWATGGAVSPAPGGVLFRSEIAQREGIGVVSDFDEEGNTPTAPGARAEALGHQAWPRRASTAAVIHQLSQCHVVAVANVVVEVQDPDPWA